MQCAPVAHGSHLIHACVRTLLVLVVRSSILGSFLRAPFQRMRTGKTKCNTVRRYVASLDDNDRKPRLPTEPGKPPGKPAGKEPEPGKPPWTSRSTSTVFLILMRKLSRHSLRRHENEVNLPTTIGSSQNYFECGRFFTFT